MQSSYMVQKPNRFRRVSMAGFDALPTAHTISALVEVDVSQLRRNLRETRRNGGKASLISAFLWAVGRNLAEFPEFNSMRFGRRIATFSGVDINVPVEMRRGGLPVVGCALIRSAEKLSLEEIAAVIEDYKSQEIDEDGLVRATPLLRFLYRLPRFILVPVLRNLNSRPGPLRELFGTTIVSSVDQGSGIPAWALPLSLGNRAIIFTLGNIAPKPIAVEGQVVVRDVLHLTIQFNHDVVDGATSARFTERLVKNIQGAGKA